MIKYLTIGALLMANGIGFMLLVIGFAIARDIWKSDWPNDHAIYND